MASYKKILKAKLNMVNYLHIHKINCQCFCMVSNEHDGFLTPAILMNISETSSCFYSVKKVTIENEISKQVYQVCKTATKKY